MPKKYESRAEQQRAYRERQEATRVAELQAKGLPPLPKIPAMPGTVRWRAMLASATALVEMLRDEMQGYYDERSESWQESDAGVELAARIESIEAALSSVEEAQPE